MNIIKLFNYLNKKYIIIIVLIAIFFLLNNKYMYIIIKSIVDLYINRSLCSIHKYNHMLIPIVFLFFLYIRSSVPRYKIIDFINLYWNYIIFMSFLTFLIYLILKTVFFSN